MPITSNEKIAGQHGFKDRRVRLSAKPSAKDIVYGPNIRSNILRPLYTTGGLLFPYTPTINDSATVNYESYDPIHTNQPFAAFKSVAAKDITVIGTFTAMNQDEAKYCLAAIHFLRTITKMYFGVGSDGSISSNAGRDLRGTPPPILLFNGYGTAIYHNVPVIVTTYNIELPQDVDYVRVNTTSLGINVNEEIEQDNFDNGPIPQDRIISKSSDITAWVPSRFIISITIQVQNTPDRLRRQFNLNDFRTGKLIKRGGWV